MDNSAATIRKGRKFDQVLAGARQVFLADGFEGASVDEIARVAKVSKATLYKYFPDKRMMFMAMAQAECERQASETLQQIDEADPPRVVLSTAGRKLIGFMLSHFGQRTFRICVAEADRFPELGREFYESGPGLAHAHLAEYMSCAVQRGELVIEDLDLAADQFAELCKSDLFPKLVFGVAQSFSDAEVTRVVDGAVATFLARYGPSST